jgi:putative hydrolase of HD superfamily
LMTGERDLSSFISVARKIQLVEVKSWAEVVIKERNAMWEGWGKTPAAVGEETRKQLDDYYGKASSE